jgi:hypothetical protein
LKQTLRTAILSTFACLVVASLSNFAQAQKIDIAFGVSTTIAPAATDTAPSLTGGAFPGVSGDVLFWHNLGVGVEVFWKASQSQNYLGIEGINYRPVTYNFNAVYSPKLASHVNLELVGGIGALDTHIYQCNLGSGSECGGTSPVGSSNSFDVDFGGGLKLYLKGGFFVRPEARYYWVNNNSNYAGDHFGRVGASIGYTFR